MTEPEATETGEERSEEPGDQRGLYLYGIGRAADLESGDSRALYDEAGVWSVVAGSLAAFVREVLLSEYSEEAIRARVEDQEWLINQARDHHDIVARLHNLGPILPAKFGAIYASEVAVREAMIRSPGPVLERLDAIAGCDEWAIHVFRDEGSLTEQLMREDPVLLNLSDQLEQASEGRSYLLRQQMQRRLREVVESYETKIARDVLNRLQSWTQDARIEPPRESAEADQADAEVVRASVLVGRGDTESFLAAVEQTDDETAGLRLELTGPWPAYSFAQLEDEDLIYA